MKIKIEKRAMLTPLEPHNQVYDAKINNLCYRVLRIENNKQVQDYLKWIGHNKYYSTENIERFDVLCAGTFNKETKERNCLYYVVEDINTYEMTVSEAYTTYGEARDKAKELARTNKDSIEEEMLTPLDQEIEPFTDEETTKKPTTSKGRPLPEPTEEDLEIMDYFFKGFSFVEYYLFDRAFVPFLIGRDLEKYPIDFINNKKDYEHIGRNFVHQIGAYPNTYSSLKREDYGAFISKVKNLDRDKLNILASVIKEQPSFKEFEKETIDRYWRENPDDFRNPKNELVETERALAYIEKNA